MNTKCHSRSMTATGACSTLKFLEFPRAEAACLNHVSVIRPCSFALQCGRHGIKDAGWYNSEYRHSAIRCVTTDERHGGLEHMTLTHRHELYQRARDANPERMELWDPQPGSRRAGVLNLACTSTSVAAQTKRQLP
jgi:hypothetical protein